MYKQYLVADARGSQCACAGVDRGEGGTAKRRIITLELSLLLD